MPRTVELAVPDEFDQAIRQEMQEAATAAFKAVAKRQMYPDYMQRKAAAECFGISTTTLDKWTRQGLPTIVIEGLKLYRKASVEKWLLDHEI